MFKQKLSSNFSEDFKAFFLLKFTEQLIKHSGHEIFEKEKIKKQVHETIQEEESIAKKIKPIFKFQKPLLNKSPRILTIPETKLPLRLQYLKPFPTKKEIDLEKLNLLLKDPLVKSIECNGSDENIFVMGTMGRKMTHIRLNKQEIQTIIQTFSQTSKIPLHEGVYRVIAGRFILSAIISQVIGSRFIIQKMSQLR
ncbi:MAG: hypothetical protein ABIA78_02030 [archaeon]